MRGLVVLLALVLTVSANYENSLVYGLNKDNYFEFANNGTWLMKLYANWCGHCRKLEPTWKEVAAALSGIIKVGAIDLAVEKVDIGGIQGFPTIRFLHNGQSIQYSGGRNAKDLVDFALYEAGKLGVLPPDAEKTAYERLGLKVPETVAT